jgi:hypothetical protein
MKRETTQPAVRLSCHWNLLFVVAVVLVGCGGHGMHATGADGAATGGATDIGGAGGTSTTSGSIGAGGMLATGGAAGMVGNGGTWSTLPAVAGTLGAGGASLGGSSAGGASSSMGGASGGTSGTDACANLSYDYCVSQCLAEAVLVDNPTCANGAWSCRSGYVLASSCPPQACGVTPDACCDSTTGIVTSSPCMADGYRGTCPIGNTTTYRDEAFCVPQTLSGNTCYSLDNSPCTEPAVGCSDIEGLIVTCWCNWSGSDASAGTWQCCTFDGG